MYIAHRLRVLSPPKIFQLVLFNMRTGPSTGIVFRLVGNLAVFLLCDDMTAAVPTLSSIIRRVYSIESFNGGVPMKQTLLRLGVLAVFVLIARPVIASNPAIVGEISGVEICVQSLCDAAVFTGTCHCRVGNKPTPGFFWVSVQHDPLHTSSEPSAIFDGKWTLTTLWGNFSGKVIEGTIVNIRKNVFRVTARLRLEKCGAGDVMAVGDLDHNDLPPTFEGDLVQP